MLFLEAPWLIILTLMPSRPRTLKTCVHTHKQIYSQNDPKHAYRPCCSTKHDWRCLSDWTAACQPCPTANSLKMQLLRWSKGRKAMTDRQEGNGWKAGSQGLKGRKPMLKGRKAMFAFWMTAAHRRGLEPWKPARVCLCQHDSGNPVSGLPGAPVCRQSLQSKPRIKKYRPSDSEVKAKP